MLLNGSGGGQGLEAKDTNNKPSTDPNFDQIHLSTPPQGLNPIEDPNNGVAEAHTAPSNPAVVVVAYPLARRQQQLN